MIPLFPFALWLSVVTSIVMLCVLWMSGELEGRGGLVLLAWLVLAAYGQFFGASSAGATGGLVLQTVLAIYLLVRWKLAFSR